MNKKIILMLGIILNCATALPALSDCTISATGVAFGNYDVFSSSPVDMDGSVTYNCTSATPITIDLSQGTNGSYINRKLKKDASNELNYNLYLDAGRTQIWGDLSGSTTHHTNPTPTTGIDITIPIFGRIPALQNASVGSYTDSITATINF
ncbi:hypothetical protein GXM_03531 [Nostoc sphaeroides CCNUC1]|uniref:Spore coat protein U/FanG domain-containing protein n=2 Tax=Nostoc sphaeroides TaxID=446679 RepID=A0A5P8W0B2_9NOSO|nr:hypothetical protein GXM_03531 [Nostoc sphaeroides CCNUC1]